MTWQLPDTYHSAGNGRGTATLKFYEGRDISSSAGEIVTLAARSSAGHSRALEDVEKSSHRHKGYPKGSRQSGQRGSVDCDRQLIRDGEPSAAHGAHSKPGTADSGGCPGVCQQIGETSDRPDGTRQASHMMITMGPQGRNEVWWRSHRLGRGDRPVPPGHAEARSAWQGACLGQQRARPYR